MYSVYYKRTMQKLQMLLYITTDCIYVYTTNNYTKPQTKLLVHAIHTNQVSSTQSQHIDVASYI